jgi:hypothetical protein
VPVYLFERVKEDSDSSSLRKGHGLCLPASSACVTHSGRRGWRPRGALLKATISGASAGKPASSAAT